LMNCPNCGTLNPDDGVFCGSCAASLRGQRVGTTTNGGITQRQPSRNERSRRASVLVSLSVMTLSLFTIMFFVSLVVGELIFVRSVNPIQDGAFLTGFSGIAGALFELLPSQAGQIYQIRKFSPHAGLWSRYLGHSPFTNHSKHLHFGNVCLPLEMTETNVPERLPDRPTAHSISKKSFHLLIRFLGNPSRND